MRHGMGDEAGTGVLAKRDQAAAAARHRGFTLIELMVTITLMGLLLALAAPAMLSWIRNSKIRTTA
jgi:type IV fimbrial biogenesis protein FimT